jgi:hypothetical protein
VLHQDAVAGEPLALEPTLQHDRDAGLEELGGVTPVQDGHGDAVGLDLEGHVVADGLDAARHHRPLDAEPALAERLPLGHRLVGRAEVEGGVPQPLHHQEGEGGQHDGARDPQPPGVAGGDGHGLRRLPDRTWRWARRLRETTQKA